MIEICSVNATVDFLRSSLKLYTGYISHERLLNLYFCRIHEKNLEFFF